MTVIDMDDIELIKSKINIVDLIQEYLPLKKSGVNFKANCPFHQEKTPSFMVSPERQIWKCFGCGKSGDCFKFLMEKEGIEFKEALDILAQKTGVVLKRVSDKNRGETERLLAANLKASQFFHYLLLDHPLGKKPLDYLKKRGISLQTIKTFSLGYAPKNWEALTSLMKKRGFTDRELIQAGLAVPSKKGCYDRFRGRVIFPLVDVRGRIIGFSGRVLDSSVPKYINTPQTPIFDKSRFLFGLSLAKESIRQAGKVILVEGEMDMILSYQEGVENVVASKGTALTEAQINLFKKYADTLVLCFDTDLAGDSAQRRGIEMAEAAGMNIQVATLKGSKDPGEIIIKDSKAWFEATGGAEPIYDYYLKSAEKRFNLKTAADKKKAFLELIPIWKKIADPLVREHYVQKLAALLQVNEEWIRDNMGKPTPNQAAWNKIEPAKDDQVSMDRRMMLEEYLISLLLHIPQSHTYIPNFPETLLTQEDLRQIYVSLVLTFDSISFQGKNFQISEFVKNLPSDLVERVDSLYLMQLDERLTDVQHWQKEVDLAINELKKMLIKSSLEKLSLQIKNAQEFAKIETLETLNKRFRDLSVKLKNL